MEKYDVIVIGGGLLGCFAARSLARYKLKIALFEKREDVCTGVSRANTAIIYSGCDTKPGTTKTSMCVRSAQDFPQLCGELGVRYSQCGSIMVSFGKRGDDVSREKLQLGIINGVRGVRLLKREEVLELEPNIARNVRSGLYVPDTGTVIPWELCLAAAENAARNGVDIKLNTEVTGITISDARVAGPSSQSPEIWGEASDRDSIYTSLTEKDGFFVETNYERYYSRCIINCAGMAADNVLEMATDPIVRISPTAGDYYILDTKAAGHIKHVIFHEPEEKGKGLTLAPTVDGNILVGPTERPGDDFRTEETGLEELLSLVAQVMPSLPLEQIIRSFGAVRPNPEWNPEFGIRNSVFLSSGEIADTSKYEKTSMISAGTEGIEDKKGINDFCIVKSFGGAMISFVGIKTPGLTCANELGMNAADRVAIYLNAAENTLFNPLRQPPLRLSGMPFEERNELVQNENPRYGRIVCRCRGVTEGEIIDSIRMFPGATTVDGVKRRTGAGSGRCQGSFCSQRVVEILARELGLTPEEIAKDGSGSNFFYTRGDKDGII